MPTPTSAQRGYPLPHQDNALSVDVLRLVAALQAIDDDIHSLLNAAQNIAGVKTFSSSPVIPTAAPGDNSGKAANTAFVQAAVAALVDSSPGALNTLNELAAALGDDENFSATITAALAAKASNAALDEAVPAGILMPYAGATAPTSWLLCHGQTVSRSTYSRLFTAIGTTFGSGDGTTTFNLPDMRGRVAVGKDNMGGAAANRITSGGSGINGATLGAAGGAETHTLTIAQMPSHTHNIDSNNTRNTPSGGADNVAMGGASSLTTNSQGGGGAHNNTQPSIVLNYIIKA